MASFAPNGGKTARTRASFRHFRATLRFASFRLTPDFRARKAEAMSIEHSPAREDGSAAKAGGTAKTGTAASAGPYDFDPETLLTPRQAAALLGISVRCLENWRHRGGGPQFVRISSRCTRYRRGTIRDFIAARTFASTAEESGE